MENTPPKTYIDANTLLNDAFRLGRAVLESGFRPNLLLALWRGGTPVGIAIQELLVLNNIPHEHFPVKTQHYAGLDQRHDQVAIHGLESILEKISGDSRVLVVDDVFDTGITAQTLIEQIATQTLIQRHNLRIATPWFKPKNNRTKLLPDYFLHTTEEWIVFPHELQGLKRSEILTNKTELPSLESLL